MDEWLTIADGSGRNTPFLWLGPNSAGHLKAPSRIMQEGNNALWHYSLMMGSEAKRRGVEHLNFYNMTLQATSYDGSSYGDKVSLVQAMMVSALQFEVDISLTTTQGYELASIIRDIIGFRHHYIMSYRRSRYDAG